MWAHVFLCCRKGQALRMAAATGDLDRVAQLLIKGANPNSADSEGETPLTWAAEAGHAEIVGFLLQRGAQINHQTKAGQTALHCATKKNHIGIIRLLEAWPGVDLTLRNSQGLTAEDLLDRRGSVAEGVFMSTLSVGVQGVHLVLTPEELEKMGRPKADSIDSSDSIKAAAAMGVYREQTREMTEFAVSI